MALTNAQLLLLKNDIVADPVLNAYPTDADSDAAIADIMNQTYSPDFFVWQTGVPTVNVYDSISWANYTPSDAPDNTATWTNRSLACQGKQFNLQIILQGRETINATKANLRAGLQDALTALPSGPSGANRSGGWAAVQLVLQRKATRAEKVLSTGTGTTVSPALMGYEGTVTYIDIQNARGM